MSETSDQPPDQRVELTAVSGVTASTGSVAISTRHYLASSHLWTATHNARRCRELEDELAGTGVHVHREHSSCASTAILMSVAFLEALVNETFADASDTRHESLRISGIPEKNRALMRRFWEAAKEGERYLGVLDKFQMALLLCEVDPLDQGANPYQDVQILIRLRNALMHFRPAWHDHETPGSLERQLQQRFPQSGLLSKPNGSPWVPIKALGAGGAEWACAAVSQFADTWTERLGITQQYKLDLRAWGLDQ